MNNHTKKPSAHPQKGHAPLAEEHDGASPKIAPVQPDEEKQAPDTIPAPAAAPDEYVPRDRRA